MNEKLARTVVVRNSEHAAKANDSDDEHTLFQ